MNLFKVKIVVLLCILGGVVWGCGSDSGSGSPAVKKGQKTPGGPPPKVVELLTDKTKGDMVRETSTIPMRPGMMERKNIPVIPPGKAGGKGLTQAEVEAVRAKSAPLDAQSRQVIPPKKPGAKGVTQGELKAMRSTTTTSGRSEVVPPPVPGGQGITEKELSAMRTKSGGARNVEVIPPQTPGGHGFTQQEVNALRPAASSSANAPVVPPEGFQTSGKAPVKTGTSPGSPSKPGRSR